MKVAVTGGSGVVGRALVRHLVEAGHEVRVLARSESASATIESLGATAAPGDVLDPSAVDTLVSDCELVFHVAGINETCSADPARLWRINVDGTVVVMEASERAGVRRLIHTSSAVTIGEAEDGVGAEDTRRSRGYLSDYERSKTAAEELALSGDRGIEVVAVNPSSVQGPGRATGTGALLLAAARGNLPFLVDTIFSIVDIDDCARGHLLAAEHGQPGDRYLLSGATLTVREAVGILGRLQEATRRPWFIAPDLVRVAAPVVAGVSRLLGRQPVLCPESARVLLHGHRYDGGRASRDLGLVYTPVEETFARTLEWYRSEGLL